MPKSKSNKKHKAWKKKQTNKSLLNKKLQKHREQKFRHESAHALAAQRLAPTAEQTSEAVSKVGVEIPEEKTDQQKQELMDDLIKAKNRVNEKLKVTAPYIIDDKPYNGTQKEIAEKLGISVTTLNNRCMSDKHPEWIKQ